MEGHFTIGSRTILQDQSRTDLKSLVGPFTLIGQVADIVQTDRIPRIQPEVSDLEIQTSQHGKIAMFKSFASVLKCRLMLIYK